MAKKKFSLDKEALYNKLMPSNTEDVTDSNSSNPITNTNPLFTVDSGADNAKSNAETQQPTSVSQSAIKEDRVVEIDQVNIAQSTIQNEGEPVVAAETEQQDKVAVHDNAASLQQEKNIAESVSSPEEQKIEIMNTDADNLKETDLDAIESTESVLPSAQQENEPAERATEVTEEEPILDNHDDKTSSIKDIVDNHDDGTTTVEDIVDNHNDDITAVEDIVDIHDDEITAVEDIVDNHDDGTTTVEDIVDNHNNEITAVEDIVDIHDDETSSVEDIVDNHDDETLSVEDIVDIHDDEVLLSEQKTDEIISTDNMAAAQPQLNQMEQEQEAKTDELTRNPELLESNQVEENKTADIPPIAVAEEPEKPAILKHNTEVNINALSLPMPVNLIESIVWANINTILTNNQICTCKRCQADASSIALNKIAVKYISCFSPNQALGDFYYKTHFAEIMSAMLLACSIVKNAPRHDEQNPVQEDNLYVHNLTEDLVITQIKKMLPSYSGCCCDRCLSDIAAIMLNNIPPKYFITSEGKLFAKLVLMEQQYHVDLTTQFFKASHLVQQSPNH